MRDGGRENLVKLIRETFKIFEDPSDPSFLETNCFREGRKAFPKSIKGN